MGGDIHLYTTPRDYEREEMENEDYTDETTFSYRYSAFNEVKGEVLRAAIAFLNSTKSDAAAASNPNVARQILSDAGISEVDWSGDADDATALTRGNKAIDAAVDILQDWVREPVGNGSMFGGTWTGGAVGRNVPAPPHLDPDLASLFPDLETMQAMVNNGDIGGMLNMTYDTKKVFGLIQCPIELARVGMRGMYFYMRLPDNDIVIYADEAALMASVLTRVFESMPEDDLGTKEFGEQMTGFFGRCVGEMIIRELI